ncbi:MAG: ZrgA family zinc uptake protein [Endozoicomonas sp.]
MSKPTVLQTGIACAVFLLSLPVAAATDEVRHVDAHIHGEGELNFAIEGSQLHLELSMPAHDILGFETIKTAAQEKQLHEALEKLETDLWKPTAAAKCQLIEAHASSGGHQEHDDHESHDDHEKHADHDSHDKHEDHADHDSHDKHGEESEEGHMNIAATYLFKCENISRLNSLDSSLFKTFRRSEEIRVQGFTATGQISAEISRKQPEVRF